MKSIKVYHYDAFSKEPNKGNPAGVVLNGDDLAVEEMQKIDFEVGFNETAFPIHSDKADLRIRYFSPKQEMDLCGHATMAAIYALKTNGYFENKTELTIETQLGILTVWITLDDHQQIYITMQQNLPKFKSFGGSIQALAKSLGISGTDIDDKLPLIYGNTGAWTLLVPIKSLETFKHMKSNNQLFPSILKEIPNASVHPFCLESYQKEADMHGRHFSSAYSGTVEDPVTGTASGVMGAYFMKYIKNGEEGPLDIIVEQGQEMNKKGKVLIHISEVNEIK